MFAQKLAPILFLVGYASALEGMSTAGIDFVFSLPMYLSTRVSVQKSLGKTPLEIITSTEEHVAIVNISYPGNSSNGAREIKTVRLLRYKAVSTMLPLESLMYTTGIFHAIIVRSSAQIKVIAIERNRKSTTAEATSIIPMRSCHKLYQITTPIGYPFVSVMSFSRKTKLSVKFPNFVHKFNEDCNANEKCKPSSMVEVTLEPYMVWHFTVEDQEADLHNTLITSNHIVNVIAGSTICRSRAKEGNSTTSDFCLSSIKATLTWGKTYLIPQMNSDDTNRLLRVNALKFPLRLFINGDKTPLVHNFASQEVYEYASTKTTVVAFAERPFGLYLLTPCSATKDLSYRDCTMVSLIPVEQWIRAFHYLRQPTQDHANALSVMLYYPQHRFGAKGPLIKDYGYISTVNNMNFSYAQIDPREGKNDTDINLYIPRKSPGQKMMLYVTGSQKYSFYGFPYDFHHSEIYQNNCTKTKAAFNDGIDNDCDNKIDEEVLNDVDDDGDGKIDEDFVEKYQDGQWTEWVQMCTIPECGSTTETVMKYVRACSNPLPTRFAKLCSDERQKCAPGNECNCDGNKQNKRSTKDWTCKCSPGCIGCQNNTGTCDRCKDGYVPSFYCLTKCPPPWMGPGCGHNGLLTNDEFEEVVTDLSDNNTNTHDQAKNPGDSDVVTEDDNAAVIIVVLSAILVLIPVALLLLYFLFLRKKPKEEEKEEEKEEAKEEVAEEHLAEEVAPGKDVAEEAGDAVGDEDVGEHEETKPEQGQE